MRTSVPLLGMMVLAIAVSGCATMKKTQSAGGPSELDQLRLEMDASIRGLETRVGALEAGQTEIRDALRSLTGLQQGLRQQIDELAKQRSAPLTEEPMEK